MRRLRPALIGVLIIADLAILLGTPFLERIGDVPRSLGYGFAHFDTDPAAAALPMVRLLLGAVLLAAILDQLTGFMRRPPPPPTPPPPALESTGWSAVHVPDQAVSAPPVAMAVRDRWHDLPAWTWTGPVGVRDVRVGNSIWQVDRFSITVESGLDFDEALLRVDVHDAFRQLVNDADDFDRRRAVVMALSAGKHWPFLGRSSFILATARITAAEASALDGVFVIRHHGSTSERGSGGPPDGLAYLVAPTTTAAAIVQDHPDLVVALADRLDPPDPPHSGTGDEDGDQLAAALAHAGPDPMALGGTGLSPPSQEAVFRIQPADTFQRARANTRDRQYIVSMAKIDRIYLSAKTPTGISIGSAFHQVTAGPGGGSDRPPEGNDPSP